MTDEEIDEVFQAAWDEFGDEVSTEFLLSITADRCDVDYERVVDAVVSVATAEG
jgi:hypothetical protein